MEFFDSLKEELAELRQKLLTHPIYAAVTSVENLRHFMEMHVFAVWDFMSLAKRLQRDFSSVELPWVPPASPEAARFINEVILGEESDLGPEGKPQSHLELYLLAMAEVGARIDTFHDFLRKVRQGEEPAAALEVLPVPGFVRSFVTQTIDCARNASTVEVAATFLFGREDVIPEMFERLLNLWERRTSDAPHFAYYLRRHIELDREEHGPLAERLLVEVTGTDAEKWRLAADSAKRAIRGRLSFWDGALRLISGDTKSVEEKT